jgi:hypothetical protein
MQYMKLDTAQREELLASLTNMPEYLRQNFSGLTADQARVPGADGAFSPIEQVWHLTDLEREGFAERIRRLLADVEPHLPDFDGNKVATERGYRSLSLDEGLRAFADARERNIAALRTVAPQAWLRSGTQEGVGRVSLCDMPSFMLQHDTAHKAEIEVWKSSVAS